MLRIYSAIMAVTDDQFQDYLDDPVSAECQRLLDNLDVEILEMETGELL